LKKMSNLRRATIDSLNYSGKTPKKKKEKRGTGGGKALRKPESQLPGQRKERKIRRSGKRFSSLKIIENLGGGEPER